jgi:peptide/nickel transport system substrate-binding protein
MASSYDIAPDKLSVTFHLRKGIKFHDGTELNAEAVKFSYDAQIENNKVPFWESVEDIDEYTVKVNFKSWNNVIISTFGDTGTGMIVSPTAVKENGLEWAKLNPVGTGPFKFESYVQDSKMILTKNDDYWEEGQPYLDGIEYYFSAGFSKTSFPSTHFQPCFASSS